MKDLVWAAARATTENGFNYHMNKLKELNEDAYNWLAMKDVRQWSRHALNSYVKSDMILSNIAETFNAWILDARDKPIITMLEKIRRLVMERFQKKREEGQKLQVNICPRIQKKLAVNVKKSRHMIAYWDGAECFEVENEHNLRRIVDMKNQTCSCFQWNLTGIPCAHAVAAIYHLRGKPEDYVNPYYHKETFFKAYKHIIHTVPGMKIACFNSSSKTKYFILVIVVC